MLLSALSLVACQASPALAGKGPRNVLILVADDLGLQVGCYGDKVIQTPNLDALAKRGVRFTHAYASVASCSPSRSVIYTGLFTHQSGQYGLAHAPHIQQSSMPNIQSLPGLLRNAGWWTGIIGKVHVLPASVYPFEYQLEKGQGRNGATMAKAAREFIAKSGKRPFFLVMGYTDPHRAAKGFGNEAFAKDPKEVKYDPKQMVLPHFVPDRPEAREDWAEYYQSISRLDRNVGMVLEVLRETGHLDDTLIIFLSDNGPPFPGAKTTLYEAGLHLPLLIAAPDQKNRGGANNALVSFNDITPTVLDWAKVKSPKDLPGRSLLPILDQENPKGWDVIYGSHQFHEITMYYPMRCLRTRTHKYLINFAHKLDYPFASDIYNSKTWQAVLKNKDKLLGQRNVETFLHRPKEELYDLTKDPNELHNVAGDPKYADVLGDLRKRLRAWQEQTRDPWIIKYNYE
jgi:N-sulfoglucosamine sulfohydrolase